MNWSDPYTTQAGAQRAAKKAGVDASKVEPFMEASMKFYRFPVPAPAGVGHSALDAREGSKVAAVAALLRRPGGATGEEIIEATGWQRHSIRGVISSKISKCLVGGEVIARWQGKGQSGYAIIDREAVALQPS